MEIGLKCTVALSFGTSMGLEVIDQGRIGSGWRVAPDAASPGFELRSRSRLLFVLRAGEVSQYCLYIRVSGRRAREPATSVLRRIYGAGWVDDFEI